MDLKDRLINVDRVCEILGIAKSNAYAVINDLNKELNAAGYLTVRGKVDIKYLTKRYFPDADAVEITKQDEEK